MPQPIPRRGESAAPGDDRELLPVADASPERRLDPALARGEVAPDQGPVDAAHLASLDLARQLAMRLLGASDEEESRGATVQPMHDTRALGAVAIGQVRISVEERVNQRPASVADRGMDDHSGRLRDHGDGVILIDDLERDRLAPEGLRSAPGTHDLDPITLAHATRGARRGVVQANVAGIDQVSHRRSRERSLRFREEAVETLTRSRGRDGVDFRRRGRRGLFGRGSRQGTGLPG